jgi:cell division protein FtsQ
MLKKNTILKIFTVVFWIAMGSAVLVLLVSAVKAEKQETCKRVVFQYKGDSSHQMVTQEEIMHTLWPLHTVNKPEGQNVSAFDLQAMEEKIEKNPWIKNADVFFDHHSVMHINVWQRVPVARLFTPEGASVFLDAYYKKMPLKVSDVLALPVFTNFTTDEKTMNAADSSMIDRIISLSSYIRSDEYWMAQVEAVNIQYDGSFDLTMQLGDETVSLGKRNDWNKLFPKLKLTYEKFARDQSWGKYDRIDLQYKNQVVCRKKIAGSKQIIDTANNELTIQQKTIIPENQ